MKHLHKQCIRVSPKPEMYTAVTEEELKYGNAIAIKHPH
jgi:hypothetical protein